MTSIPPELPVSSFARGLKVLDAVVEHGPQRVEQIALHADMPVSSTYRYIRALVAAALVTAENGIYALGPRLVAAAQSALGGQQTLHELGAPVLRALARATEETAMLTVRVGSCGLVLDRVESTHAIRLSFERGAMRPLHAGATVKMLLAYAPPELLSQVIEADAGLERFTARTPDAARLLGQLAQIRSCGYVVSHGEADPHAVGIGVPVFRGDSLACGLSVAGPAARLTPRRIPRVLDSVMAAGRHLSATLTAISTPAVGA